MGKKNKNNATGGEETNNSHKEEHNENQKGNNKKNKDDKSSKTNNTTIIVLKLDLHCEGCSNKVVKLIRSCQGVEGVKCEWTAGKISVVGDVDPLKLKEKIEQKTHKKVEVVSPLPKKESKEKSDGNNEKKSKDKDNKVKDDNEDAKDNNKKSKDEKKPKELSVTTAVLKVHLHCQGCIDKIEKIVSKTKGYKEMKIDKQKDLVMVTGAMDMRSLSENLSKQLKKNVEIVEGKKKEKEKEKDGGNEKKVAGNGGGGRMEGRRMQMQIPYQYQYQHPPPPPPFNTYGPGFYGGDHNVPYAHAPQIFSDENPNACTLM